MKFFTKKDLKKRIKSSASNFDHRICVYAIVVLFGMNMTGYCQQVVSRQSKVHQPNWWFGLAGGANLNLYYGSTRSLNLDVTASPELNKGHGFGGNGMVLIEFHKPGTMLGFMLLQGADDRSAKFKEAGTEFIADFGYYTVEPSITISPRRSNLYFYAGPRLGLLWTSTFKYIRPNKPDYPNQADPEAHAYFRNLRKNPVSFQVGVGYNIMFSPASSLTQIALSPFVTYLPTIGNNNLRTIESLKLNTIRAGIILKAARTSKN